MKTSDAASSFLGGGEQWPPGFRFHPTDEELVLYYLKKKICRQRLMFDVIGEVDVYKADPDELPGLSQLKTGDRQWFFFSPRDRKYPNGGRSSRATRLGYWKATGKDRVITCSSRSVGIKKTLVFYKGRAPSGKRTNWVMHEYTLDEEELKRCPAKDSYALYKVYKKSGAGPKNGEQYGAPFREEDWADDEKAVDGADKEQVSPLQLLSQYAASVDNIGTDCPAASQINGIEFLNRIVDDPLVEPISEPFGAVQPAGGDEDTRCTLVKQSLLETNVQDRAIAVPPSGQFNVVQPCFNPTHTTNSQFGETSDVAFATDVNRQGSHGSLEDFLEDYLEIDDLTRPEPSKQNIENPFDDLQIENFNGLCDLDFFQDVSMFPQDVSDTEPASHIYNNHVGNQPCDPIPFSFTDTLENDVVDQAPNSYFSDFQTEMVQPISQPYPNTFGNEMVYQFNNQMPHDPDVVNQLWMHNENFNMATPAVVPNQGSVIPPTSGVVYAGVNENQFQNQNQSQNQIGNGNEGGESWFSSTLWSFVETIPTTPTSAAESTALVNKAFERLSSFGRKVDSVKVSWLNTSANAGDPTATRRRSRRKYNRGFLLFSLFGVLCAVLWVFTGVSMRVLGRCLS